MIGRFSTTAKLDLFNENNRKKQSPFQWYEFKFGEKRAGELLAVFELIEVNPVNLLLNLPHIFSITGNSGT